MYWSFLTSCVILKAKKKGGKRRYNKKQKTIKANSNSKQVSDEKKAKTYDDNHNENFKLPNNDTAKKNVDDAKENSNGKSRLMT